MKNGVAIYYALMFLGKRWEEVRIKEQIRLKQIEI